VKKSDLGEYEENAREKQNIQYTRQSTNSPSNQSIWMPNTNFPAQEGSNQNSKFLNDKRQYPLKPRQITSSPSNQDNQIKRQTQLKTSTPPELENTRFYQLSLDTPQDKHRLLKQQSKLKHI
jgi:hypothetical protein